MIDPSYRLYTYCPEGISSSLKEYLSQPVNDEMTASDVIAINLLGPFGDSHMPFACTFVGWAAGPYETRLEELFAKLNDLTVSTNRKKISMERLGLEIEGGLMQIAGAYPLNDLQHNMIESEYENVSFILNRQISEDMMVWLQDTLIDGLPETDKIGVICAILGDSEDLLNRKIQEIASLLQMTETKPGGRWNDPDTTINDVYTVLLFYSAPQNGLQSYSLFFGPEQHVYDSATELLRDVWRRNLDIVSLSPAANPIAPVLPRNIHDLQGFSVGADHPAGEIVRVLFTGQGHGGVAALIDYLLDDIEVIEADQLWYERSYVRTQLIDFKTRLIEELNQEFMDDLRGLVGLILE